MVAGRAYKDLERALSGADEDTSLGCRPCGYHKLPSSFKTPFPPTSPMWLRAGRVSQSSDWLTAQRASQWPHWLPQLWSWVTHIYPSRSHALGVWTQRPTSTTSARHPGGPPFESPQGCNHPSRVDPCPNNLEPFPHTPRDSSIRLEEVYSRHRYCRWSWWLDHVVIVITCIVYL